MINWLKLMQLCAQNYQIPPPLFWQMTIPELLQLLPERTPDKQELLSMMARFPDNL